MRSHTFPDAGRLADDIETLARFRDPSRPGFTRRPFTGWYESARQWIVERMKSAGLDVRVDAVGNVIGKKQGKENLPTIMLGSHIDTVDGGGRFDGMVGVLGSIELARCLEESKTLLAHAVEIVSFFAEEPTEFGVSAVGSRAMAGVLDDYLLQQKNPSGQTLGAALKGSGYDTNHISQARRRPHDIAVYLELHIEQGPQLERMDKSVGIVNALTGFRRHRYTWSGRADHAGTMPMEMRRDALAGACESVLDIESRCCKEADAPLVGTVARISVWPNAANVVPDRVEFISDIRSPSASKLEVVCSESAERARAIAARRRLSVDIAQITAELPIEIPTLIREQATGALLDLGLEPVELVSMAGHDANQLARIVPVGMIFIRCKQGRSHCPEEESSIEDICLGVAALLGLVRRLDQKMQ